MSALRWSYMDHWRADTPRGPMTQYGSRRLMDDFVKQISAVGFEGLDMFDFQIYGLTQMFGSIEKYQEYLQDHGITKIVNLFRGIMYDPRVADPHVRETHDEIVESTRRMLGMWEGLQIENLIVMPASLYADTAPVTKDKIKAAAECWNRVGEASAEFGVRTTGHHEFFCAIRTEEDILSFYEWTDPRYVSFFCDTAQHCIAGIDPVALYEQLHDRCSGFHFKDTREVDTTQAFANRPDAELTSTIQGWARLVTDRVVPVFRRLYLVQVFAADGGGPDVLGGTGSDCAGAASFPGRGGGVAGQAGAGRAHSRCQQVRNASFQGQVRLIFRTRARAWRTSRAGRLSSR